MITKRLKGISLFASAGIGETYFKEAGIDIVVANELLEKRADLYRAIAPETTVVCGDITKEEVFEKIGYETIGVRIPDCDIALNILKEFGPMLTTSVNDSGEKPINEHEEIVSKYSSPSILVQFV